MIILRPLRKSNLKSFLFSFFLALYSWNSYSQSDFCSARNTSYKEGERLVFRVYYNMGFIWINAGNATFSTSLEEINNHMVYHITGEGRTAKSYEWFYKVKDKYETFIDKESMLPERFLRNVHEGSTRINQDIVLDQRSLLAYSNGKSYPIAKCTQDVLSAIYFARNINYSKYNPGDKIPFSMFLDDKLYSLYIKYMGKEKVTTKNGTYNAIKIVPLLIQGTIFDGGEKMVVWVSDDQNHVPLRVDSPILVGSIKVDLIDYSNLRSPFTSLINQPQ